MEFKQRVLSLVPSYYQKPINRIRERKKGRIFYQPFFFQSHELSLPLNFASFPPTIDNIFCNHSDFFYFRFCSLQSHLCLFYQFFSAPYYIISLVALMRKSTLLRSVTMRVQINSLRDKMGEYDWLIREGEKKIPAPTPKCSDSLFIFYQYFFLRLINVLLFVLLKTIQHSKGLEREFFFCVCIKTKNNYFLSSEDRR